MTRWGYTTRTRDEVRVGDVVKLAKGERAPADGVALATLSQNDMFFVKTDQLDGETDWKHRVTVKKTQLTANKSIHDLFLVPWMVIANAPNDKINEFEGLFYCESDQTEEALSIRNFIQTGVKIESDDILLLVTYVGVETKVARNSVQKTIDKTPLINHQTGALFIASLFVSVIASLAMSVLFNWTRLSIQVIYDFLMIFTVFTMGFPLIVKANLIVHRLWYLMPKIQNDPSMDSVVVRNPQVIEDLGAIDIFVTDKTGTLTQNDMEFRHLFTPVASFEKETFKDLKEYIFIAYEKYDVRFPSQRTATLSSDATPQPAMSPAISKDRQLMDTLEGLMVCNNVIPIFENGKKTFQSSSPDELAVIQWLETLGFSLDQRTLGLIVFTNPVGRKVKFLIKEFFPFSSEKRKMGILVQNIDSQELIFYVKGADSVFGQNVKLEDLTFIEENCQTMALSGLRTMVVAQKRIREGDYQVWKASQLRKVSKGGSKVMAEEKLVAHFERDVSLLCVTGIEDKLQEDVKSTLQRLREAGIQLWMLTGDKFETAKSIAISSGMKPAHYESIEILKPQADLISRAIGEFDMEKKVLFLTGDCFDVIFQNPVLEAQFFEKALRCVNVNVCRCSPKQKTKIVNHLKQKKGRIVCAVGDGGNDVGMIKKASVGLGIRGKEGLQASLASDFSISQFKAINDLVFWHGRNAILNSSLLTLFSFYRSFIYVLSMIFFSIFFFGDIDIIYRGPVILFFFNLMSNFFVFPLALHQDISKPQIMNYARLYRMTQKGQTLFARNHLLVLWISIAQVLGIYVLLFVVFPGITYEFLSFALIACSLLVIYLTIFSFSQKALKAYLVSVGLSLFFSAVIVYLDAGYYFQTMHLTWKVLGKIWAIALAVWAPLEIALWCRKLLFPSNVEKIMTELKIMEERKKNNENLKIIL